MPTDEPLPLHDRLRITLVLYACVMTIYFSAGHVARPPWISLRTPIDDAIPFVPEAMIGYALAYVVPVALLWVEVTLAGMRRMMRACLLAYAMAAAFFVVMPVRDADPPLQGASWAERLLDWNRAADVTKNAFPSMHVGLAVLLALIGFRRSPAWGWGLLACAAVISVSTLLVKQHFVADIPAGALVAFAAYRIIYGPGRPQDSA
jgi:membrane-associated phospholipid phosphatase